MNRTKLAMIISGAATTSILLGNIILLAVKPGSQSLLSEVSWALILGGLLAGIVSFFFRGFGQVFGIAWRIARWGFIAVPFPINLFAVIVTFLVAFFVLFLIPIVPVAVSVRRASYENDFEN